MSNILIVGSNGFIGKNICKRLASLQHTIYGADRALDSSHEYFDKYTSFDVTVDDFDNLLDGIDHVIYLVSTLLPHPSNLNIQQDITENLHPVIRLLESIRINNRNIKVIFSSSGGTVYGDHDNLIPEDSILVPKCSYGIIKVTVEHYLKLYYDLYGITSVSLRLSNPYGPGQNINKPQGVVGIFLNKMLAHDKIEIWGDGSVIRDFIHVDDVANAFSHAINATSKADVFNIGSGIGISLRDLISMLSEMTNTQSEIIYSEPRKVDVPCNILDISKAYSLLKWKPNIKIHDGLSALVADNLNN